ncbi:hypothetical protein L1049_015299 [Liquidambar formosana]|uniref:Protein kinase domain-containing protein n=1 Tax=Liquidambar formosana TaxID=63359 RepID=A0AAP0S4J0_LIQFO
MESSGRHGLVSFTPEQLKLCTQNFSEENLLGKTQFGKLYRGKILIGSNQIEVQEVTLKIWEEQFPWEMPAMYDLDLNGKKSKLRDEVYFLQHPSVKCHPNLVKLIGYCNEGDLFGVVYDLNPLDTLENLLVKDNFTWHQRIKVALGFARLLDFLQDCRSPYIVRNIDAAHILIDQDFNPILCDFGMLSGGIMGDMANNPCEGIWGSIGYIDFHLAAIGKWSVKCDVYSYGVLLLSLIAKRVIDKKHPYETIVDFWAQNEYKTHRLYSGGKAEFSLVHESLEKEPEYDAYDGSIITKLAMSCLEFSPLQRPTMKEIAKHLQDLYGCLSHGETVGIKTMRDEV